MSEPEPYPETRIGDAERDDAVALLQEHLAAGRITNFEFNDRLNVAMEARTMGELQPLFADLPGRKPGQALQPRVPDTPVPARGRTDASVSRRVGYIAMGLLWPAALIVCFATGWQYWWIILIPLFCSGIIGRAFGLGHHDDDHRQRRPDEPPRGDPPRQLGH